MIMKASHRAVMVCSESFIFLNHLFELFFELFGEPPNKSNLHVINYTLQGVIIIKSLI